jgi:hypothetical protein
VRLRRWFYLQLLRCWGPFGLFQQPATRDMRESDRTGSSRAVQTSFLGRHRTRSFRAAHTGALNCPILPQPLASSLIFSGSTNVNFLGRGLFKVGLKELNESPGTVGVSQICQGHTLGFKSLD